MATPTFHRSPQNGIQCRNRHEQRHNVFQPPQLSTPDGSLSSYLGNSSRLENNNGRKRARTGGSETKYETPYSNVNASWSSLSRDLSRSAGTASPPPLTDAKYRIAEGLHTPTHKTAEGFENRACAPETDLRRRWTSSGVDGGRTKTIVIGALDRERNGGRNLAEHTSQPHSESWSQFVYNVVGDVAGKMWEFCKANTFRGFTAGGGTAYELTPSAPKPLKRVIRDDWWEVPTPIPGQYPEEEFEELRDSDLDMRPIKRLQTSQGKDWVVVNPSPSSYSIRRNTSFQATHSTSSAYRSPPGRQGIRGRSSARRLRPSTARLSSVSDSGSPSIDTHNNRSASFASPRLQDNASRVKRSPATAAAAADVERYTAKRQREERQADASMKKLNQQLKMMIRQGKEALESKVEVQDDGYASEDIMDHDEISS